jgi:hypothetical protein
MLQASILTGVNLAVTILSCWHAGWLGSGFRIQKAILSRDENWRLIDSAGRDLPAVLLAGTRVMQHLIWLHWRSEFGSRQMLLMRWTYSSFDEHNEWRRLVVGMRLLGARTAKKAASKAAGKSPEIGYDGE